MQQALKQNGFSIVFVLVLVIGLAAFWWGRLGSGANQPPTTVDMADGDTVRARVLEIVEAGEVDMGGVLQPYQIARVQILEGPFEETTFEIDYGRRQIRPGAHPLRVGQQLIVTIAEAPDRLPQAFFIDFIRTPPLLWLLGAFVIVSLVISGWKGLRSLLAMLVSFTVIFAYILPRILAGADPVWISITGSFVILASTLYLVYGWTLKTHAAVLGTLTALVITGLLAALFVDLTRLSGYGSEEAMFLSQQQVSLNLRGLVLGGILIGALGVLDDLVITQASVIFELQAANPTLKLGSLFQRGMRIGQDHVAATVNTLVLAYVGAGLPLLLLVSISGENWANFLNREFVTEEVVRTLVGSLGLMLAVPLTTGLACLVALHHDRLGGLRRYLGPASQITEHDHHHH